MNRRLRVMVLDQAPGVWGAQQYLLRLAGPLADRGIDLVLAAPEGLELSQVWSARGLPAHQIPLPAARSVRSGDDNRLSIKALAREAVGTVRTAFTLRRAALAMNADVIAANGHAVHLDAVLAGLLCRRPVVLHLHEEMTPLFGRMLRALAVAGASRTIAVSAAVAAGLPRRLQRRATVIANGVDIEQFSPGPSDPEVRAGLGADPAEVLLVALTRLDPEKCIEDLINGLAPLREQPGWHLSIVGSTSAHPEYARQLQDLARHELGDRVTFAGRRDDVVQILRASDVLVHAGIVEGMPLNMIEAHACGVPVVAYAVAGVGEAVRDQITGLLAPGGAAGHLGSLMAQAIRDTALRSRMGAAARRHAIAAHSLDTQADAQHRLLAQLAGRDITSALPRDEARPPGLRT